MSNPQVGREEAAPTTISQSYLQMPYNRYVWLRKEFMDICKDILEAMILRAIEYEIEGDRLSWLRKATELATQGKEIPEEPEWWITLSHRQIMARLYDAFKNEKTVRAKLQSLEEKQFILVRQNPDARYGAPQYTINRQLVQEALNALPPLPGIREAAKSQAPLPDLVPPPKSGTPSQNGMEGGTKSGRSPLPNLGGPPYQIWEEGGTKSGTPYKKERNKELEEAKERETLPVRDAQPTDVFLSLSSEISSPDAKGESPASVKGVPKSPDCSGGVQPMDPGPAVSPLVAPSTRMRKSPRNDAPVVDPKQNDLLSSLTEEQANFWLRWCAKVQCAYEGLNAKSYPHVVELAPRITTTEALDSLYDYEFARLSDLAKAMGTRFVPPWLGNLVKALPDWEKTRAQKARDQAEAEAQREFLPGTGRVRNFTAERLAGNTEPITYSPLPTQTRRGNVPEKPPIRGVSGIGVDAAAMLAQWEQRRAEKGQQS